jgi:cell division septation protein DedD
MSGLGFQSWMAGMREWRAALLISILCMAAITVAVLRPNLFSAHDTKRVAQSHHQVPTKPVPPAQHQQATVKNDVQSPAPKAEAATTQPAATKPAPATASPPRKAVATPPQTHGYYIQLATFRERTLAEKLVAKLAHIGLHTQLVEKKGMYAVWAGPWATRKEADSAKDGIYRKTGMKGFITQK